jgi:predicted NAD/FAD-binding protein
MLADPTSAEAEILSRIPYQENATYLHTDTALMPRNRLAWASWNSRIPRQPDSRVAVTYNMNILQKPATDENLLVTLNHIGDAAPERILQTFHYAHPQFSTTAVAAQGRWAEISGVNRTHYCGAYWRNGFHEDGVVSALRVCELFGLRLGG